VGDNPPVAPRTFDEELLRWGEGEAEALSADDARRVREMAREFAAGFGALARIERAVAVFGSARTPRSDPDYALARQVAARLGSEGYAIMTGGGPGIMEAANRGAQEAGALSVGCNIELPTEQAPNEYLDLALTFRHFFARKVMFVRYASGFVIFPGGYGTLDELFEALTLIQTRKVRHFPVVLVGERSWQGLLDWVRSELLVRGHIGADDLALVHQASDPDEVAAIVREHHARQQAYYDGEPASG
jgi:uncharacterized protein (TIGR00730 family)